MALEESRGDISVEIVRENSLFHTFKRLPTISLMRWAWLLNEVGMLVTRLTELISQLQDKLDLYHDPNRK